jgi:hypothetical protein
MFDQEKIRSKLRQSWSRESSSLWSTENPACGQCNVTALVIHDHCGGEILKTPVDQLWHFYNRIDGCTYDFTAEQFSTLPAYLDIPSSRAEAMQGITTAQYDALSRRFGNSSRD